MSDPNNREIEEKLAIVVNDMVMMQIGLLCTLYFDTAHECETRETIIQIADEYWSECGENLRWMTDPKTYHWKALKGCPVPKIREHISKLSENHSWQITLHGGPHKDEASDFRFEAAGTPAWELKKNYLSYMQVCFPLTWFADRKRKMPALILNWCQKLKPLHGYGGLGILQSLNTAKQDRYESHAGAIARRFPGIEIDYPLSHALYLKNRIKGGNWLTVIGEDLVGELGGMDQLEEKLGSGLRLHSYRGGALIQAGPKPQMGDVNRQRIPELYKKLAQVLKPIRIKEYPVSFHHAGENRFNKEISNQWLRRFDD